jgi:hypothetical protein
MGSLLAPIAQANTAKLPKNFFLARTLIKAGTSSVTGAVDQVLMGIVNQVMYEKTPSQVINELVYAYGDASADPLPGIAQMLLQQSSYLGVALEAAQCIVNVLPPTSPHVVAAKLVINELSACNASLQTILAAIPQNSQAAAPGVTAVAPSNTAPVSTADFESAVMTIVTDAASAVHAIAAIAPSGSSSTVHHHGSSVNK